MKSRIVTLAILLLAATGGACADNRAILGTGAELTSTPCNTCSAGSKPNISCPSGRAPQCFERSDGTCGWQNKCADAPPAAKSCGGLAGGSCATGEFCNIPAGSQCGAADQPGTCTKIPEVCTQEYAPVCGCDGKTYGNACTAAGNSVSVSVTGECPSGPGGGGGGSGGGGGGSGGSSGGGGNGKSCGGLAGIACAKGEFCNIPAGSQCGAADQPGTCTAVPSACDLIYSPVCGCDGKTYGNACAAAAASVSVSVTGECPSGPGGGGGGGKTCGGIAGIACATGEYCNFPVAAKCGAGDQTGTCAPVPAACTKEYAPVCGCDGKTYGNACTAASASVSVAATGECAPAPGGGGGSGKTCGGIAGLACAKPEYCNYPVEAKCGAADQTGTCATMPQACTLEYAPVCGCDGKTYGNACSAASAGISVSAKGACP